MQNPWLTPDCGVETASSIVLRGTETLLSEDFAAFRSLLRDNHKTFLEKQLRGLPEKCETLEAGKCWMLYWTLHPMALLSGDVESYSARVVDVSERSQDVNGGFGGAPGLLAHIPSTYATVLALCTVGTIEALEIIDRERMYKFLKSMKRPSGAFAACVNGEAGMRATYCAVAVASLLDIMTPELIQGVPEFIMQCQRYDGGFARFPGMEAHGGYAFCALSAAVLMGRPDIVDAQRLLRWVVMRQANHFGGFTGRPNKLVDGCYSFWDGATLVLLERLLGREPHGDAASGQWVFDQVALQEFILLCCQDPDGGLRDKPGMRPDHNHSCYCLSGLSLAQHNMTTGPTLAGAADTLVERIDPALAILQSKADAARAYFRARPFAVPQQ